MPAFRFEKPMNKRARAKPLDPPPAPRPIGRWMLILTHPVSISLFLTLVTLAVYWPVLRCDFAGFDDVLYVTENPHTLQGLNWAGVDWAFGNLSAGFWHPLTWLSLMLDVTLFGTQAGGFHLTNLLLHVACTVLLYLALRRLTGANWRCAIVAALFAIHPLHVESVAWIAERKDVLSTLFWMLTLLFYARYAEKAESRKQKAEIDGRSPSSILHPLFSRWYWLALVCFACGLMSKSMLVTLPVVMLLLDYWPLQRLKPSTLNSQLPTLLRLVAEKLPFFLLALIVGFLTVHAEKSIGAVTATQQIPLLMRMSNAVVSVMQYFGQMFWPVNLAVFYPYPKSIPLAQGVAAALILSVISIVALWLLRRRDYLAVGWFWFVITLLPVSGLIQVGPHARADRYTYVPLIGVFILLVWGAGELFARWRVSKAIIISLVALVFVACGWRSRDQLRHWQNPETLFRYALAVTRDNYIAYNNVGYYLLNNHGNVDDAIDCFREAVRINPHDAGALENLGFALAAKGQTAEAIGIYQQVLQIDPNHFAALNDLGNALSNLGKTDEAIQQFRLALRSKPDDPKAHNNLGVALARQGKLDEAMEHFRAAIQSQPDNSVALNSLGNILVLQHRYAEALPEYEAALRVNPGFGEAHANFGFALAELGRYAEAVPHYREALRSKADYAPTHYNLGCALVQLGQRDEAIAQLKEALRLQPDYEEANQKLQELTDKPGH
jgi:protein O-mannosyl-transferase